MYKKIKKYKKFKQYTTVYYKSNNQIIYIMKYSYMLLTALVSQCGHLISAAPIVENDTFICGDVLHNNTVVPTSSNSSNASNTNMNEPIIKLINPLFVGNQTNKTCQDCEFLVHVIQHQINTANATLQDIIKIIQAVCQKLDSPSGKECIYIIDQIQSIIKWIANGLSFKQICQKLGLCSLNKVTKHLIRNS